MTTDVTTILPNILEAIRLGALDNNLNEIEAAVKLRQTNVRKLRAFNLAPGDTIHFSAAIKPRYLIGLPATVVRVNQSSVTVRCPDEPDYQRFRGATSVRCDNQLIQELS